MCVTTAPARLSNTILYAAEVREHTHVLGYQNTVQNLAPGPNAMILPFPAIPGSMTRENVVSTEYCPNLLKDMARTIMPVSRGAFDGTRSFGPKKVEVFESGIYTVVLAHNTKDIPEALQHDVPSHKKPNISPELFEAYSRWYPQWPIALCCFNNRDAASATPMLWWYYTISPRFLFAPAVDCHTGGVPDLYAPVDVDHTVIIGSRLGNSEGGTPFYTRSLPQPVQHWVIDRIMGYEYKERMINGDFVFSIDEVRNWNYRTGRVQPDSTEFKLNF